MSAETTKKIANPGPLGLLGFGMTTVLLNLHNAGLLPLSIVIVAMGIALGGLAQIIAGIRELCQGNSTGILSASLGYLHILHVHRYSETQQSNSGSIRFPDNPVRTSCTW